MYDTMTANLAVNIDDVAVALNSTQHSILLKSKDPYPKGPFRIHKIAYTPYFLLCFPRPPRVRCGAGLIGTIIWTTEQTCNMAYLGFILTGKSRSAGGALRFVLVQMRWSRVMPLQHCNSGLEGGVYYFALT